MFKIQTLNKIASVGLNQFPRDLYEIASEVKQPDVILVRSYVMHEMTMPSSLKVIGRAGAGVNNIPLKTLTQRGIPVFNTPGANANAVRELVIAGMLLASRHICAAWNFVQKLQIEDAMLNEKIEQEKKQFVGTELLGKTVGVIGLGSIGVKVANALHQLGMNVIGFDPNIEVKRAWELSATVKQAHSMDDVFKNADFITFHVPLNHETRNMVNSSRLSLMKPDVVLLNFSRDGIIDNEALLHALRERKVLTYVNDFPNPHLKNHPQVINLPHLGASTREAEENCAVMLAKQVRNYLESGAISCSANFPTVEISPNTIHTRLAIVNANVPNMVAQISAKLAEAGLNIVSLVNQSRDEIAYTLVDLNDTINEQVLGNIAKIPGVIQIRKIPPNICSN